MTTLRNRVQLLGNLGIDPEIVKFESGKKIAKFTVATNETYTDAKGNKTTDTQWHNVVAWGKQADLVEQYLIKETALPSKENSATDNTKIRTNKNSTLPRSY